MQGKDAGAQAQATDSGSSGTETGPGASSGPGACTGSGSRTGTDDARTEVTVHHTATGTEAVLSA